MKGEGDKDLFGSAKSISMGDEPSLYYHSWDSPGLLSDYIAIASHNLKT